MKDDRTWIASFERFLSSYKESLKYEDYLVKSLSPEVSNFLTDQKFWILLIEFLNKKNSAKINIDDLISLFNQAFNYIVEDGLIKSYFLRLMRTLTKEDLSDWYKTHNIDISGEITNSDLFRMLQPYAQFLAQIEKRKKQSPQQYHIQQLLNTQFAIHPLEKFTNESLAGHYESITTTNFDQIEYKSQSKKTTPIKNIQSVTNEDVMIENSKKLSREMSNKNVNTDKNEGDLNNSNNKPFDDDNSSMHPNICDTDYQKNCSFYNIYNFNETNSKLNTSNAISEKTELFQTPLSSEINLYNSQNKHFSNLKINVIDMTLPDNGNNLDGQGCFYIPLKSENQETINSKQSTTHKVDISNDITDKESLEKCADIIDEDNSKKNISEENLDQIDELNSQNASLVREHKRSCQSSGKSAKSQARSRSKSNQRRMKSIINEEFPSDLVEGSIKNFNINYNGTDSKKNSKNE